MDTSCWTSKDVVTAAIAIVTVGIAAGTAWFTAQTFRMNARTRRAEVLISLHKEFFVEVRYKKFRSILDDDSQEGRDLLKRLVQEEGSEFTDFLNYFELVAYLKRIGNLEGEDIDALLRYYLDLLQTSSDVKGYIEESSRNFEHLKQLLDLNNQRRR